MVQPPLVELLVVQQLGALLWVTVLLVHFGLSFGGAMVGIVCCVFTSVPPSQQSCLQMWRRCFEVDQDRFR